ncbi:MAG: transcription antitermination factor NusB [Aquificaceae bacterium]|nr:transcription antitermination factor NusB [Aquificaceae bacterium]
MMYKTRARRDAFLILYQWDMKGEPIQALAEEYISTKGIPLQEQRRYIRKLVRTFAEHASEVDKLVGELSEKWHIDRVGYVEKNILRVALVELLYMSPKNYKPVVFDYVRMAHRYAGKKGALFVNGILGRVLRERLGLQD